MTTYHVFGRTNHQEPLAFVTTIQNDEANDLKSQVEKKLGAEQWVELVAFPENGIEHVVRGGKIQ